MELLLYPQKDKFYKDTHFIESVLQDMKFRVEVVQPCFIGHWID